MTRALTGSDGSQHRQATCRGGPAEFWVWLALNCNPLHRTLPPALSWPGVRLRPTALDGLRAPARPAPAPSVAPLSSVPAAPRLSPFAPAILRTPPQHRLPESPVCALENAEQEAMAAFDRPSYASSRRLCHHRGPRPRHGLS